MEGPGFGSTESAAILGGFSADELVRYGRHLTLAGMGIEGQERLRNSRMAIVGLGGLGSPVAQYLAAAGVGTIGLVDGDRVELSNLQRQVLYGDADIGRQKVEAAAARLRAMNRNVNVQCHGVRLDSSNALEILRDFDLVIDGSDNFPTRYLVNDASVLLGIPTVHGSVLRFEGRVSVFGAEGGPCYRCLYPEPPPPGVVPDCQDAGVLGVMPGLVGTLQAAEAIKLVCETGEPLVGRLLLVDATQPRFHVVTVAPDPLCPACGTRELTSLIDYETFCGPTAPTLVARIEAGDLAPRLGAGLQLVDVREPWEWAICRLPGATLVPMGQLEELRAQLDPARETIVYCHHGSRSLAAAAQLIASGFRRVGHLEGGIDGWSREIDPSVPRY
jgi:adenylyltransferase/sulfurtransferase